MALAAVVPWGEYSRGPRARGIEATVPPQGSTLFVANLKDVGLDFINENWGRDPKDLIVGMELGIPLFPPDTSLSCGFSWTRLCCASSVNPRGHLPQRCPEGQRALGL